jgi:lipopolysaccharide/colanic/teichoic acid biosynthesis glycosyltransferase
LSPALSTKLLEPILEIGLTVAVPEGVTVSLAPSILEKIFTRRETFLGVDTTLLTTVPQRRGYLLVKRVLDCVISLSGLILLAPLFLLIALTVKLSSSKGPVFYPWRVLGKNGKPFVGYKFRTMVPDADKLKEQLRAFNEMRGPVFKMRKDPRILPFGRFLRKFSLDELPQLYSVLKGDMSLVGPRPPSQEEAERFEFWQRRKLSVKPGISCLWQINGRNEICAFSEWARLDLEYIQNASLLLDLKIILLTFPAVLSGRGAS